jgi:hypothetical protein
MLERRHDAERLPREIPRLPARALEDVDLDQRVGRPLLGEGEPHGTGVGAVAGAMHDEAHLSPPGRLHVEPRRALAPLPVSPGSPEGETKGSPLG